MWRDLERLCAKYGLPFHRPSVFPRPSLLAARVACTAAAEPWCGDFVRAVFHANFAEGPQHRQRRDGHRHPRGNDRLEDAVAWAVTAANRAADRR